MKKKKISGLVYQVVLGLSGVTEDSAFALTADSPRSRVLKDFYLSLS